MRTRLILSAGVLAFALTACSSQHNGRPSETERAVRRVEHNAGQVADTANKQIEKGVDGLDKTWETPAERARREREENDTDRRY